MLYRRNCNTLLSSSLQRCYINGVCFAFQLAALWKRRSVFVLGNINLHLSVERKRGGKRTCCCWSVHPSCAQHNKKHIRYVGQEEKEAHKWEKWMTKSPQDLMSSVSSVLVPCQNNRAASLCLRQEASMLSSINQTQSIDSYLANKTTNQLGFDRCWI